MTGSDAQLPVRYIPLRNAHHRLPHVPGGCGPGSGAPGTPEEHARDIRPRQGQVALHRSECLVRCLYRLVLGAHVRLVFQLVEYQRALTSLLSAHVAVPGNPAPETSFPTLAEQSLSEAEWTRKRAEMDDEGGVGSEADEQVTRGLGLLASPLSPEEAGDEARMLDEAMRLRLRTRD